MPKSELQLAQGRVRAREHDLATALAQQREVQRRVEEVQSALKQAKVDLYEQEEPLRIKAEHDAKMEAAGRAEFARLYALAEAAYDNWGRDAALEWYKCGRKVLHYTQASAEEHIERVKDPKLHAYRCVRCTGYHVGHGTDSEPPKDTIVRRIVVALRKQKL